MRRSIRLTIAQLKAILLGTGAPAWARAHRGALASEAIAAVVKTTDELSAVACRLFNQFDGDAADDGGTNEFLTAARGLGLARHDFAVIFKVLAQMAGLSAAF